MELRHLRYFVAVAEELHFGRAALRLNVAQPPLSIQIRQLEEQMGVDLLQRTTRKVELTQAGELFLNDARRILAHTEQAVRSARRVQNGELGQLIVGFLRTGAHHTLPNLLQGFHRRFPDVELLLKEMENSLECLAALKSGSVHAGILRPPIDGEEICHRILICEPLVVALPESHRLADRTSLRLNDLAREPFLIFQRRSGTSLYDGILGQCERRGFSPRVVQELSGITSILCLVAAGVGIAILPGSIVALETRGVVYLALDEPDLEAQLALAWRRSETSPPLARLLDTVRELHPADEMPNEADRLRKTPVEAES